MQPAFPVSASVSWPGGVTTNVTASRDRMEALRAGNATGTLRSQFGANVTFAFRTPRDYLPLPAPIRTALRYASSDATTCIQGAGAAGCIPIAQSRRSEYTLLLDTDMPPNATAALSASRVITEDVHANRKFSQFVLTATVRVTFQAGEIR